MSNPDLKMIENHIKDLLFKKNPSATSPSPPAHINVDLNYNMSPYLFSDKSFLHNCENRQQKDRRASSMPLDCGFVKQGSSGGSQLIDLNVLTNFAAKHADIGEISDSPRVLPHPEFENDLPAIVSPGKNILSHSNAVIENKCLPKFLSKKPFDKPQEECGKNLEKNCLRSEQANSSEQFLSDRKKKRKARKQTTAKEKGNRKMPVSNETSVKQLTPSPKKESPKQETANLNKHYSSHKEALKTTLPKKDYGYLHEPTPNHQFKASDQQLRVPLPIEEKEYTISCRKDGYIFSCHLCNYEASSRDYIHKHLTSETHRELKKQVQSDRVLPFLPQPLPTQIEAIDKLLMEYHTKYGLQDEDLLLREKFADRLIEFVNQHLTGCSIDMIGSSVTKLGLKSSKVDFILKVAQEQNIPDSLELLYEKLLSDPAYYDVVSEFKKKRLGILFADKETGLECNIILENAISEKFAKLFCLYSDLDPRVRTLASCFRYWAKLCCLDNQDRGTLPPFTFSILLVYFLQQTEPPVLPVLHEIKEYGFVDFEEKYVKGKAWKSENNDSVGELWLKLFYYYNFVYEMGKHVICVRSSEKVMCSEKNWATKFYAIEDPFSRRNIAHVIPNFQVCQYIKQCFLKTYRYFAFPLLKDGEIKLLKTEEFYTLLMSYASAQSETKDDSDEESVPSDNEDSSIPDESSFLLDFEDQDPEIPIENVLSTLKKMSVDEGRDISEVADDSSEQAVSSQPSSKKTDSPKKETKASKEKSMKTEERKRIQAACSWDLRNFEKITAETFVYKMDPVKFKSRKDVPFSCKQCKSSGHLKKNCPNDDLPPRLPLPEMTSDFLRVINKILYYIRDKNCVDNEDKDFMLNNMIEIQSHIQKLFPEARLSMFGSFCNGFGFKSRSDMDFCLTFKDHEDSKGLDCAGIIEKLGKHLQDYPKLENIVPVTSAKVPIVKFACTESGLEGDISLYNTLAIANTEMLELYSRIDTRVQILGFGLKYFAKVLGICDASRGSLSSYAYILMVIYFLQQRTPPVIPVLQELHIKEKPSRLVDGWNVWYFKDLDKLPEIWPDYGKNTESVAELWLGLLSFYSYDFDWREYVVSIKQKAPLTAFRKLWMTDQIAIEDPFDLSHNLGAGLSRKMNMYILRTFVRARERFGTPLPTEDLISIHNRELGFLFDRRFLNSGSEPPHDRGCRACGKIGHIAKNCTQEKLCACCKKPGHIVKNCPKKRNRSKPKHMDRNSQEKFPLYENKNNNDVQNLQGQSLRPHSSDRTIIHRNNLTVNMFSKNSEDSNSTRKFLQMGFPTHRHPPPGFPMSFTNPPPGFKAMHPNSTKFSRFPSSCPAPFPRTIPMSQSPPKPYGCSPPKNYMGSNKYHPEPVPTMSTRPELHMSPSNSMHNRMWQPNRMPPHFADRRKRTN